ncbi:hypothetical protein ACIBI9_56310 [Nonomuraea sp. NPDC050451]|uniref:hypothetical protein n=1 Tax=Nonomuraea sp. NPDC050451 TaxID=3364364 RepID=UPI00379C18F1
MRRKRVAVIGAAIPAGAAITGVVFMFVPEPPSKTIWAPLPEVVDRAAPVLPSPSSTITIKGLGLTGMRVFEHPSDPVKLGAYRTDKSLYLRKGERFVEVDIRGGEVALAPDGRRVATLKSRTLRLLADGKTSVIRLPAPAQRPIWSRDGRSLLLTARDGFIVVDPQTREATLIKAAGDTEYYSWLPDGSGVLSGAGGGVRFRDLAGRETRVLPWTGRPIGVDAFSPSGDRFVTYCPSVNVYCVWNAADGNRVASLLPTYERSRHTLYGWFDEARLFGGWSGRSGTMDLWGGERRTLTDLELDSPDDPGPQLFYATGAQ